LVVPEVLALRASPAPVEADRPKQPHELRIDRLRVEVERLRASIVDEVLQPPHCGDYVAAWMRPLRSRRRPPWRPARTATISARIETPVSAGVSAPRSSPAGPESRSRRSSGTPASNSRSRRFACVLREPIAPT